jgi:hypothetical protein
VNQAASSGVFDIIGAHPVGLPFFSIGDWPLLYW